MNWSSILVGAGGGLAWGLLLGLWLRGRSSRAVEYQPRSNDPVVSEQRLHVRAPRSPAGTSGSDAETAKTTVYPRLVSFGAHEGAETAVYNLRELLEREPKKGRA